MEPARILAKAEAWKKKAHRLSMELRLKTLGEARRFLREHSVVLWNVKAELPNLLDATLGRIANGKERQQGRAVENCRQWRTQLLSDPDFIDCAFFRRQSTVIHQDLWPYVTVISRLNSDRADASVSRDARKILAYLKREGPAPVPQIRKSLKFISAPESRIFKKACSELLSNLLIVGRETPLPDGKSQIVLDTWENAMPRPVKTSADKLVEKDAGTKLLAATLNSSVISNEKHVSKWFPWQNELSEEWLETLIEDKTFIRVNGRSGSWIIPRKILH